MPLHRTRWKPTLRLTISTFVCVLIVSSGSLVLAITYYNSRDTLREYSRQMVNQVGSATEEKVAGFIKPAKAAADLTLKLIKSNVVATEKVEDFESFFFEFLEVHRTVAMLNYGDEQGNFIMAKRQPDGSLSTKLIHRTYDVDGLETAVTVLWKHRKPGAAIHEFSEKHDPSDRYDPRTRPWYLCWTEVDSQQRRPPRYVTNPESIHWTDVYVFHSDQLPGITASLPHLDESGQLRGVIEVDIALSDISKYLQQLQIGKNGKAFILDQQQRIIAIPNFQDLTIEEKQLDGTTKINLRMVQHSTLPELATLAKDESFLNAYRGAGLQDNLFFNFVHQGRDYLAMLRPIRGGTQTDWLLGVVIPEDDFLGEIKRVMWLCLASNGTGIFVCLG